MDENPRVRASKRPTVRDVADRAGVSKSLVSLAFVSPESVGRERLERIRTAAQELGFRPNRAARSLSGARGDFVGILVSDPRNPVLVEVVEAARSALARSGRAGLMTSAVQASPELLETSADGAVHWSASAQAPLDLEAVAMLGDLRPSGVIVVGSVPDLELVLQQVGSARVVLASARPPREAGADAVATVRGDDEAGMRLLVDHLVERGHGRIAHIGGEGGPVASGREEAFIAAMAERGLATDLVARSDFSQEAGEGAAASLLDLGDPPTAITALNDIAAIGAMAAVRSRGLSGRIAVTGYDGTYLASLGPISLTSVDPGNAEIGRRAAQALLADAGHGHEELVEPVLRVRRSSAWGRTP